MYYIKLGMGPRWTWLGVLYAGFAAIAALGVPVATGSFGTRMQVHLVNDGPVTIVLG